MFEFLDKAVSECAERILKIGGEIVRYEKGPPATADQIDQVTRRFGGNLPPELLQLGQYSDEFEFVWCLEPPDKHPVAGIYCPSGRLSWRISTMQPLNPDDYWWVEEVIAEGGEGVWHDKTIIDCECDGDFLAYSIDAKLLHVPVYCSKDGAEPCELVLAQSLADFYKEWSRVGFLSINKFRRWPQRTGLDQFDVSYFREFEMLLSGHAGHRVLP